MIKIINYQKESIDAMLQSLKPKNLCQKCEVELSNPLGELKEGEKSLCGLCAGEQYG